MRQGGTKHALFTGQPQQITVKIDFVNELCDFLAPVRRSGQTQKNVAISREYVKPRCAILVRKVDALFKKCDRRIKNITVVQSWLLFARFFQ